MHQGAALRRLDAVIADIAEGAEVIHYDFCTAKDDIFWSAGPDPNDLETYYIFEAALEREIKKKSQ